MNRRLFNLLFAGLFIAFGGLLLPGRADAATKEEAIKAGEELLEKNLNELNALFKKQADDRGQNLYMVAWEYQNSSARIFIRVKHLGTKGGKDVISYSAWTQVAQAPQGETLPPAVIKLICTETDTNMLGNFSLNEKMDMAFANMTGVVNGMTPEGLWISLTAQTLNVNDIKKKIEAAQRG